MAPWWASSAQRSRWSGKRGQKGVAGTKRATKSYSQSSSSPPSLRLAKKPSMGAAQWRSAKPRRKPGAEMMRHHRLHTVAARVVRRQAEEDLLDELVHQSLRHAACLTGPGAPMASGVGRIFFDKAYLY